MKMRSAEKEVSTYLTSYCTKIVCNIHGLEVTRDIKFALNHVSFWGIRSKIHIAERKSAPRQRPVLIIQTDLKFLTA